MSAPILITGGTQRLGLAIAQELLERQYPLIVTYRTKKPSVDILQNAGARVIQCDFEREAEVSQLAETIKDENTSLRAIIHNASDWNAEKSECGDLDLLDKMMAVHVKAPYQLNWALKDLLLNTKEFSDIIHLTDYVQEVGSAKHIAYSASKGALHNLTLSFAKKLAPKVKVNSIAPALVMHTEGDTEEQKRTAEMKSLLQSVPGAQEAVNAVLFLLSSDYVTGQTIHLNGGRHLK